MKIIPFESREQWMQARQGKITGTRLGDIVVKRGTTKKLGFYEVIAERLMVDESDFEGYVPNETPMDRGTRLQKYAIDQFRKLTGKDVDESLVMWVREDNEGIAVSPDGLVKGENAAVETKCLSAANHIKAYITNAVPDDYKFQILQYFIVNDALEKVYMCFYDPRIPAKQFFYITITRAEMQAEIEQYLAYELQELKEIDEWVLKLSGF